MSKVNHDSFLSAVKRIINGEYGLKSGAEQHLLENSDELTAQSLLSLLSLVQHTACAVREFFDEDGDEDGDEDEVRPMDCSEMHVGQMLYMPTSGYLILYGSDDPVLEYVVVAKNGSTAWIVPCHRNCRWDGNREIDATIIGAEDTLFVCRETAIAVAIANTESHMRRMQCNLDAIRARASV